MPSLFQHFEPSSGSSRINLDMSSSSFNRISIINNHAHKKLSMGVVFRHSKCYLLEIMIMQIRSLFPFCMEDILLCLCRLHIKLLMKPHISVMRPCVCTLLTTIPCVCIFRSNPDILFCFNNIAKFAGKIIRRTNCNYNIGAHENTDSSKIEPFVLRNSGTFLLSDVSRFHVRHLVFSTLTSWMTSKLVYA